MAAIEMAPGRVYSWDELGAVFGFKGNYLGSAGGMPISAKTDSVLLITHPEGGKTFDYGDHWDGRDLIYTGKGQRGDQQRSGANLDVAENRRALYAFEAAGPKMLRYLGSPRCVEERVERAPDSGGTLRDVLRFRLRFPRDQGRSHVADASEAPARRRGHRTVTERQARRFDPGAPPSAPVPSATRLDPAEIAALQEKAVDAHFQALCGLNDWLERSGWHGIEEIPAAIDLRATAPDGSRVIFEVKSITDSNETSQMRGALAQLLEYRLEYGAPDDQTCAVVNRQLSARRLRLLEGLGVPVLVVSEGGVKAGNDLGWRMVAGPDPDEAEGA